jgi:ribosome-associated translation inhibitor RaiA
MQTPLDITFRGMETSTAAEASIERWVERLERDVDRILRCSVVVEVPHRKQRQGKMFHVRIQLAIPGHVIEVSHDPGRDDLYVAISDAFRAAHGQLLDAMAIRRGDVKLHA